MKTLLRVLAIGAAAIGALLALLLLYLAFGDLGRHKAQIEEFVTAQIGRPFAIEGPFVLDIFPALKLQAEDVHIANTAWSSTPQMIQVGRFATEIGLWSLFSGPVHVHSLELRDVAIVLERNDKGENNWTFGTPGPEDSAGDDPGSGLTKLPIAIQHATVSNLKVTWQRPGTPHRIASIETLTVQPDAKGLLALEGRGALDGYEATLAGQVGPLDALLSGRNIRLDLSGGLGNLRFAAKGGFGRLHPLDGADLAVSVGNPDLGTMLRNLRLPAFAEGNLDMRFSLKDAGDHTGIDLTAQVGDLSLRTSGKLGALGMRDSDLTFKASAADAARLASVFDIKGVPAGELAVAGRIVTTRAGFTFDGVRATLGEYETHVDGTIPVRRDGAAQLRFEFAVPSLSILKASLPPLPLKFRGELAYKAGSNGKVGSLESLRSARNIQLDLAGGFGDMRFAAKGGVGRLDPLEGADFTLSAKDPDLGTLLRNLRLPVIATGQLSIDAAVKKSGKLTDLDLTAQLGDLSLHTTGKLAILGLRNSDLTFKASAADAARLASVFDIKGVPAGELAVAGHIVTTRAGFTFDGVRATLGEYETHVDGTIPVRRGGAAQLRFEFAVPSLSILKASLPPLPLKFRGELAYKAGSNGKVGSLESLRSARNIQLDLAGGFGDMRFAAKGGVGRLDPLEGADFTLSAKDPDLGTLLRNLRLPVIAEGSLDMRVSLKDAGKLTDLDLTAQLGDLSLHTTGKLAVLGLRNSDLTFKASAADAARLASVFDIKGVPPGELAVAGHLISTPTERRLDGVHATLGEYETRVDGTIPVRRGGTTQLRFDVALPSLEMIRASLPHLPLKISGELTQRPQELELKKLVADLGASRIQGAVTVTGTQPRRIVADFDAPLLDLTPFLPKDPKAQTKPAPKAEKARYLFNEQPIPFRKLRTTHARVHLVAAEIRFARGALHKVDTTLSLIDGGLRAQLRGLGGFGGSIDGSIDLTPVEDGSAAVKLDLALQDVRSGFASGDAVRPEEVPPINLDVALTSTGATARELASASNGSVLLSQGPGKSKRGLLDRMGGDIIAQLLIKLNPFVDKDPYTQVDCVVARMDITDGKARLAPVLMQTRKVAITASGTIDFRTEKLLLNFNTRPRQGIGVSPGMFTNPFLDLTGTLASPSLGVGAKGMTSGAVAVATGGISVLAKGAVDRVIGETNQCSETLKVAQQPPVSGR